MSNETIKTKPPTCRELQARIDALREELDTAHFVIQNDRADLSDLRKTVDNKLDAEASRMITADIKTALSTATKYYEQAHAVFNDTLAASKQVYMYMSRQERLYQGLKLYLELPWYKRMFARPLMYRPNKEKK